MAMARRPMALQHPNSGNDVGPLLQPGKTASSESSASEKAEDTGERHIGFPNLLRSSTAHPGALAGFIRAMDDAVLDYDSAYDYASTSSFEFQRGDRGGLKPLVAPYHNKAAPSKWDDAEKWLVSQSPIEALVKAKTKSGPLHGHHGYGGLHLSKRVTILNQHEWHVHSHAAKNGYETHIASDLSNGGDTLLLVDGGGHHQNVKLVTSSHPDQSFDLPGEWTKKIDAVKGPGIGQGVGPNFAFIPVPTSLPKGSSFDCYPVADEPVDMKEVSISHEGNYDELFLKPMLRTRKPTSDSLASVAPYTTPAPAVRSVSMRDMGTEMTPIASQEPSRTGTPIRATTPTLRSPVSSCPSTPRQGSPVASPVRDSENVSVLNGDGKTFRPSEKEMQTETGKEMQVRGAHVGGKVDMVSWASKEEEDADASKLLKNIDLEEVKKNVLETRAAAWEEAEQSKYMARFKREEAKILAWENHEKAKAEAEMRRIEVKVEKARSQLHEKVMNKLAAARGRAEERRAAAEAKHCEQAAKAAHRADYIRRTGRLPSSFFSCGFCH